MVNCKGRYKLKEHTHSEQSISLSEGLDYLIKHKLTFHSTSKFSVTKGYKKVVWEEYTYSLNDNELYYWKIH